MKRRCLPKVIGMSRITKISLSLLHFVLFGMITFVFSGCAAMNDDHDVININDKFQSLTFTEDLQNTYFKKGKHGIRICTEPDPDEAQTFTYGISDTAPKIGDVQLEDATGGLALGGRNPEVLIARELLFRACELSLNVDANYDQMRSIYTEFLTAVKEISKYQRGNGSAPAASAVVPIGGDTTSDVNTESSDSDSDSTSDDDDSDDKSRTKKRHS